LFVAERFGFLFNFKPQVIETRTGFSLWVFIICITTYAVWNTTVRSTFYIVNSKALVYEKRSDM